MKANNLPAVLTFIDFRKAFDSVHRAKMMRILKAYGIPPNLLRAIESMYSGTKARVTTADGDTDQFDITVGVLQGDTLPPFLFIIVLDYAMRKALGDKENDLGFTLTPRKSRRNPKVAIADTDFADDIALLADAVKEAQELLTSVETECKKVGLGINGPKTKALAYNIENPQPLRIRDGSTLDYKDDFKYLGSWVDQSDKDIAVRKALAWKALNGMQKIWASSMNAGLKKRFFLATVESILLYGCETWTLTVAMEKALDGCYTRMLRRVTNVHWSAHITNEELYGNIPKLSDKVASRRMRLAGHCHRHPELSTQKLILWEPTHGHRDVGRPRSSFIDTLKRDTGAASVGELGNLMSDRVVWRTHVTARLRPP